MTEPVPTPSPEEPGPRERFPHDRRQLGLGAFCLSLCAVIAWGIHAGRLGIGTDALEVFVVLIPVGLYLLVKGLVGFDLAIALGLGRWLKR